MRIASLADAEGLDENGVESDAMSAAIRFVQASTFKAPPGVTPENINSKVTCS